MVWGWFPFLVNCSPNQKDKFKVKTLIQDFHQLLSSACSWLRWHLARILKQLLIVSFITAMIAISGRHRPNDCNSFIRLSMGQCLIIMPRCDSETNPRQTFLSHSFTFETFFSCFETIYRCPRVRVNRHKEEGQVRPGSPFMFGVFLPSCVFTRKGHTKVTRPNRVKTDTWSRYLCVHNKNGSIEKSHTQLTVSFVRKGKMSM